MAELKFKVVVVSTLILNDTTIKKKVHLINHQVGYQNQALLLEGYEPALRAINDYFVNQFKNCKTILSHNGDGISPNSTLEIILSTHFPYEWKLDEDSISVYIKQYKVV